MKLNEKIEHLLKEKNIGYQFIPLPEDLPMDIASHVKFHKINMENAMATILYKTEKGIIAAVKRADTQINLEKLKKIVGVTSAAFASKEDLKVLGIEVGLVPYLGLDIPYFIDAKVLEIGKAYGIAGVKSIGMAIDAKDMVKANDGTVGDFTLFEKKIDVNAGGKRFLSGITPSGDGSLHIGNYLGAVKQFIELAKHNETYLMVADYHALTTIQDKKQLQHNVETLVLNELALLQGFLTEEEFKKIIFFRQSDVPMHTECQSIINNITPLGLLKRAHAYKDKLAKDVMEDDINVGLFSYPMLMAADILLYKPDLVPVGKDQKQHIEITRDIAERFNKIYRGDRGNRGVFKLPDPYIPEETAVILGTDGQRKMSKSLGNLISIFETEEVIKKQVNGIYTDPTRKHATDPGHTEGNMVFTYLDFFGEKGKVDELKELYRAGKVGDIEVKNYLYESLLKTFGPARERYADLVAHPEKVKKILEEGAAKANAVARATMQEVREAIGLVNKYSFSARPLGGAKKIQSQALNSIITIDDFARVEMRVGKVTDAIYKEGSDKLIRLVVDFGPGGRGLKSASTKVIFTGVRGFGYTPTDFIGKQFFFITNLAPRKMMNEQSQGMILAVDGPSTGSGLSKPIFLSAEGMPIGVKIR